MKIKKQLIIAMLAIALPLSFISCGDDDKPEKGDDDTGVVDPVDPNPVDSTDVQTFFGGVWTETSKGAVTYITCEDDIIFKIENAKVEFVEKSETELEMTLSGWGGITTKVIRNGNSLTFPNSFSTSIPAAETFRSLELETTSGSGYIYEEAKSIDIEFEVRGTVVLPHGADHKVLGSVNGELKKK
ncbi:hypothetical protein LJC16_03035 [Bacteroidales bacterium OttesenSCG-928-C19]|nr:hypothetical protein [Bacteroidales bacterium OttesenSCG-928-C19]